MQPPTDMEPLEHQQDATKTSSKINKWPETEDYKQEQRIMSKVLNPNPKNTNFGEIDFNRTRKNKRGKRPNLKFFSWNIDGIRAWVRKDAHKYVAHENPDAFCLQVMLRLILVNRYW